MGNRSLNRTCRNLLLWSLLAVCFRPPMLADGSGYVGRDVCAGCHKDIAASQARTNMAGTWRGLATTNLPATYSQTREEGPAPAITYSLKRSGESFKYRVQMPGRPVQVAGYDDQRTPTKRTEENRRKSSPSSQKESERLRRHARARRTCVASPSHRQTGAYPASRRPVRRRPPRLHATSSTGRQAAIRPNVRMPDLLTRTMDKG